MTTRYHDDFEQGGFYHIYNRSINKENLFRSNRNYIFFLKQLEKYLDPYIEVISYCLMPTHFHFFIRIKDQETQVEMSVVTNQFKRFFSSYSLSFNLENNRHGSLFQKRFKRIKVEDESYFTTLIHYIHHNPIHHHYTNCYKKWRFSSYNAIISTKPTKISRELVLKWFGGKEEFIKFHELNLKYDKIKLIVDC